jgi:hypothetical protein
MEMLPFSRPFALQFSFHLTEQLNTTSKSTNVSYGRLQFYNFAKKKKWGPF